MGWLWFVGTLVPVIGLVQVGEQSIADRYSCLPSIGLSIAVVWGVESLWPRRPGRAAWLAAMAVGVFAACIPLAQRQVETWRSPLALWSHADEVTRDNAMAQYHLARLHLSNRDFPRALRYASLATELQPDTPVVQHMLGVTLSQLGRYREAREHFERALLLDRHFSAAKASLAEEFRRMGDLAGAISLFDAAAREDPRLLAKASVQSSFARALALRFGAAESFSQGVAGFRRMLLRHPGLHLGARDLAWILATHSAVETVDASEAIAWAEHAIRASRDPSPVYLATLGFALEVAGFADEAWDTSERGVRLALELGHPDLADEIRARREQHPGTAARVASAVRAEY